jgi:hypothetical protein
MRFDKVSFEIYMLWMGIPFAIGSLCFMTATGEMGAGVVLFVFFLLLCTVFGLIASQDHRPSEDDVHIRLPRKPQGGIRAALERTRQERSKDWRV